jgi:hypothetical protein
MQRSRDTLFFKLKPPITRSLACGQEGPAAGLRQNVVRTLEGVEDLHCG